MGPCPMLACASAAIGWRGISASSLSFLCLVDRTREGCPKGDALSQLRGCCTPAARWVRGWGSVSSEIR